MTLTEFMDALAAEGVIGDEYEERVAEFIERRKAEQDDSTAIVRRGRSEVTRREPEGIIPFPTSAQDRRIRGTRAHIPADETPAEAEERWTREEMDDPDGVFAMGGSTAGGIFGDAPIATDRYDPAARQRAAPAVAAQVQIKQLEVLERMEKRLAEAEQENRALRAKDEEARLGPGRGRRRLGGKKR
jgi:hypothetical protein